MLNGWRRLFLFSKVINFPEISCLWHSQKIRYLICFVKIYNGVSVSGPLTIPAGGRSVPFNSVGECCWGWFIRGSALNGMLTLRSAIVQLKTHEINLKKKPPLSGSDLWITNKKIVGASGRRVLQNLKLRIVIYITFCWVIFI